MSSERIRLAKEKEDYIGEGNLANRFPKMLQQDLRKPQIPCIIPARKLEVPDMLTPTSPTNEAPLAPFEENDTDLLSTLLPPAVK